MIKGIAINMENVSKDPLKYMQRTHGNVPSDSRLLSIPKAAEGEHPRLYG